MARPNPPSHNKVRHNFFLNPYPDMAFTKYPKCDAKTRQRKLPLVIHIGPNQVFVLNKTCRYCPACDLLIAQKDKLESLMAAAFEERSPEILGNKYLVVGSLDRSDWRKGAMGQSSPPEVMDRVAIFKDIWSFEVVPGGWYPDRSLAYQLLIVKRKAGLRSHA